MIHIENINVYMQSAPNLGHDPDYPNQILSQVPKETSGDSQSTPNPPPGYDWILSSEYEELKQRSSEYVGLKQRSDAWNDVCVLIKELDPNWLSGPGNARIKALKAIRKLAGSNQG